jgi:hypothetical protein
LSPHTERGSSPRSRPEQQHRKVQRNLLARVTRRRFVERESSNIKVGHTSRSHTYIQPCAEPCRRIHPLSQTPDTFPGACWSWFQLFSGWRGCRA